MKIRRYIEEIEDRRGSRVVVFAASNLDFELLPSLYDTLCEIGRSERLDVVFYCRGGGVVAARRVALLFHEFTEYLTFIVPHHCESAGTITVLGAREIIAGKVAMFSPIDPLLQASASALEEQPPAISFEEVRLFTEMAKNWFGMEERQAGQKAWSVMCDNFFPTTLTSFYRSMLEVQMIGEELLSLHMPEDAKETSATIIEKLLVGFHSHSYALTRDDLANLGLSLTQDEKVEDSAWNISRCLRASFGGGARQAEDDDWFDAVAATRDGLTRRRRNRSQAMLEPKWEVGDFE